MSCLMLSFEECHVSYFKMSCFILCALRATHSFLAVRLRDPVLLASAFSADMFAMAVYFGVLFYIGRNHVGAGGRGSKHDIESRSAGVAEGGKEGGREGERRTEEYGSAEEYGSSATPGELSDKSAS